MSKEDFNYEDFKMDMVQSENKFFAHQMGEKNTIEFRFVDDEVLMGKIKWYDELSIGILNESGEEVYVDKRSLKFFRAI